MTYKEYFSPQKRTQITGVWKDVFDLFTNLRDNTSARIDEQGYEWHDIKLDIYRFINIVRTMYEKLNTPNSKCLVKEFHDQLSRAAISRDRFCLKKGNQIICCNNSHITEYERNIIFGGLYYVLYKQQASFVERGLAEKVKAVACKERIPHLHYFYYFENALSNSPKQFAPIETNKGRTVAEYDKMFEQSIQIENYKKWLQQSLDANREYFHENAIKEYDQIRNSLDACQKSLPTNGVKPQTCGATIEVPKETTPNHIKDYIQKHFSDIYNQYFSVPNLLTLPKNRSQKSFRNIIQNVNPDKLLRVLHQHIDGKGGKDVGIVIGAAFYKYHYLTRYPTETEFTQEFTNITTQWRAIQNAFKEPTANGNDAFSIDINSIELKIIE